MNPLIMERWSITMERLSRRLFVTLYPDNDAVKTGFSKKINQKIGFLRLHFLYFILFFFQSNYDSFPPVTCQSFEQMSKICDFNYFFQLVILFTKLFFFIRKDVTVTTPLIKYK